MVTQSEAADLEADYASERARDIEAARQDAELAALMAEVAEHLVHIEADLDLIGPRSRAAVEWLLRHSAALVAFLQAGTWQILKGGHLRRFRGGMIAQGNSVPPEAARMNALMFRDALTRLVGRMIQPGWPVDLPDSEKQRLIDTIGKTYLARLENDFSAQDGNPVMAWEAYELARLLSWPLPAWVWAYFDQCAANVRRAITRQASRSAADVPKMFGFASAAATPGAALGRARRERRDEAIFVFLHTHREPDGGWSGKTMVTAAGEFGVQPDRLRMAYKEQLARLGLSRQPKSNRPS